MASLLPVKRALLLIVILLSACQGDQDREQLSACSLPACGPCECDQSFSCDNNCDACDPECGACRPAELDCSVPNTSMQEGTNDDCKSDHGASQLASEPCCPAWGIDACGAGLFCAAFDGRTQPTCYPERSRLDQTECTTDVQCVSGACNESTGKCMSTPGLACSSSIGCAPAPDTHTYVCALDSRTCLPTSPEEGGLCVGDQGCSTRHCVNQTCTSGFSGAACIDAGDCSSRICVSGQCSDGGDGSRCSSAADCGGGRCVRGTCSNGLDGSACTSSDDCTNDAPHCVHSKCNDGWYGDDCYSPADCHPDYPHCTAGHCDDGTDLSQPCTASAECARQRSDLGLEVAVLCDTVKHTCVIAHGGKCNRAWDTETCETGYRCQDEADAGTCSVDNSACSGSYCCGPMSCSYSCYDGWACLPDR